MSAFKSDPLSQIRDLLRGYQPGFAFVKELIQNAEDAEASCIQLHWHRGFTQAETENPLLQGPALIVINDGPFEKTHKAGIETLGLGSKTADSDKIG